jgi:phage repressor protein C with HTH and peptisase S24 domain
MNIIREIAGRPWLKRAVRFTRIDSNNMEPDFRKGDFLMAVPASDYEIEGIYILADGGVFRVQKCGKRGHLWLLNDNPLYSRTPYEVSRSWFIDNVVAYVVAYVKVLDHRFLEG